MAWVFFEQGDQAGSERALARARERRPLAAMEWELSRRRRAGEDVGELENAREQALARSQRADEQADAQGDAEAAYRVGGHLIALWESCQDGKKVPYTNPETGIVKVVQRQPEVGWRTDEERRQVDEFRRLGEQALRRAVERGSADAAAALGHLFQYDLWETRSDQARAKDALPWYRRADEFGHASGAYSVGVCLDDLGDTEGAEAAFRRAEIRGHPSSAKSLASLLRYRKPPDWEGAEAAYRRAANIGYSERAWRDLAVFLTERGDLRGAEDAHQQAVNHGEQGAEGHLEFFYQQHPDLQPPTN